MECELNMKQIECETNASDKYEQLLKRRKRRQTKQKQRIYESNEQENGSNGSDKHNIA